MVGVTTGTGAGLGGGAIDANKATDTHTAFLNASGCFRVAGGGHERTRASFKTIRGYDPAAEFADITPGRAP